MYIIYKLHKNGEKIITNDLRKVPDIVYSIDQYYSIYYDNQNVHNNYVSDCIDKSLEYLLNIKDHKYTYNEIIEIFKNDKKHDLLIYYDSLSHIIISIWNYIDKFEEIKKILYNEMYLNINNCYKGKIACLINSLSGFDDNIVINISENEQMCNISRIFYLKYSNYEDYKFYLQKEFNKRGFEKPISDFII